MRPEIGAVKMTDKIIKRLTGIKLRYLEESVKMGIKKHEESKGFCSGIDLAVDIVREVAEEGKTIKTNGDKIRNMSDEELSYVVTGCCGGCEMIKNNFVHCEDIGEYGNCKDAALKWLKNETEPFKERD